MHVLPMMDHMLSRCFCTTSFPGGVPIFQCQQTCGLPPQSHSSWTLGCIEFRALCALQYDAADICYTLFHKSNVATLVHKSGGRDRKRKWLKPCSIAADIFDLFEDQFKMSFDLQVCMCVDRSILLH